MQKAILGIFFAAMLAPQTAAGAQWIWDGWRPTLTGGGGAFSMVLRSRLQIDAGTFTRDDGAPQLHDGILTRRFYLGAEGAVFRDLHYEFRMDFAAARLAPGTPFVNLAHVAYDFGAPGSHLRLNAGIIKPIFTLGDSTSSAALLFLERASVVNTATGGYGGGTSRPGAELTFERTEVLRAGDNLLVSGAFTGRSTTGGNDGSHIVGRIAYRLWMDDASNVQIGGSAARILDSGDTRSIALQDAPEIRVDGRALTGTGGLTYSGGTLWGLEASGSLRNVHVAAEYYGFGIDRPGASDPRFSGWYVEAGWMLTGETHPYLAEAENNNIATFANPHPIGPWGAFEIAARYSTLDLDWRRGAAGSSCGLCVRGGEQKVWSFGLNWYASDNIRILLDYMRLDADRLDAAGTAIGRRADAVAARLQFTN